MQISADQWRLVFLPCLLFCGTNGGTPPQDQEGTKPRRKHEGSLWSTGGNRENGDGFAGHLRFLPSLLSGSFCVLPASPPTPRTAGVDPDRSAAAAPARHAGSDARAYATASAQEGSAPVAHALGWTLLEMDEGLIDDAWLQKKPKWKRYRVADQLRDGLALQVTRDRNAGALNDPHSP
jgi:hypothetical protein